MGTNYSGKAYKRPLNFPSAMHQRRCIWEIITRADLDGKLTDLKFLGFGKGPYRWSSNYLACSGVLPDPFFNAFVVGLLQRLPLSGFCPFVMFWKMGRSTCVLGSKSRERHNMAPGTEEQQHSFNCPFQLARPRGLVNVHRSPTGHQGCTL